MPQERTEAIVVHGVDFSETSRIITFLTPERGRLACLAKGVKRAKNTSGPVLDTLNRVELVYYWKDGRQVQNLAETTLLDGFAGIKADFGKSVFAAFPLEVATKVAHENEPSEELYETLVRGMESLALWNGDTKVHVCWQVLQLMSVAGFEPTLERSATTGEPLSAPKGFAYSGGVTEERADYSLTPRCYETLCSLTWSRAQCPDLASPADVFPLLRGYVSHQLECDLKCVRVIDQIFAARSRV